MFRPVAGASAKEVVAELQEALDLLGKLAPFVGSGGADCEPFDRAHVAVRSHAKLLASALADLAPRGG